MSIKVKIKVAVILIALLSVLAPGRMAAAKRYWVGTGANLNWNSTGNWSTLSGGASGASVPGSTDSAYYDANGTGQCSINATVSVRRFEIGSGYTDTVKQNAYLFAVGTSGMILNGGTFQGGSLNMSVQGIFTLAGSNFISTSAVFSITGSYTFSSGTFSHNNGEIRFIATLTINGSTTFYKLHFASTTTATFTINSSSILTVLNEFKTSGTQSMTFNTGTIHAQGNITISNTYFSATTGGTTLLIFNGTGNQTIAGSTGIGTGLLCNIRIDKSAGELIVNNYFNIGGNFEYVQGDINDTASTCEFVLCRSIGVRTISGKPIIKNLIFYCNTTNTNSITDTITVTGRVRTTSSGILTINTGVIKVLGDLLIENSSITGGGTATFYFAGTGDQIITGRATITEGRIGSVKINKTSGTLFFKNIFSVQGNWTYIQGVIDATTYNSTVAFVNNVTNNVARTLSGKFTLNKVTIYASGVSSLNTITSGDTITVNSDLMLAGSSSTTINSGTISLKGDLNITNTQTGYVTSSGVINICGISGQTINGAAAELAGKICSIQVNKPSGTLTLKDYITFADAGSWKIITGTVDATTFSSTLVFTRGAIDIQGKQTLFNLVFNPIGLGGTITIPALDSITINGELKIKGTNAVIINTGVLNPLGNITVTNSLAVTGGGTATINICGTGNQTLTGSGLAIIGCLSNVKVNKNSGTLYLSSLISLHGSSTWTYIKGIVDPGTSSFFATGGATINCGTALSHMYFNNFKIQGGIPAAILAGNLYVKNNFEIDAARSLTANNFDIEIGGNWTVAGTFNYNTSKVIFNGSSNQYQSNSQSFYNVEINKPNGKYYINGAAMGINNSLVLINGVIASSSTKLMSFVNNSTVSGGSDSSYISGPCRKTGDDIFVFPLGDTLLGSGAYHPLTITAPSVSTNAYTAQYYSSNQAYGSTLQTDSLVSISNCEHWLLTRTSGTSIVVPSLGWNTNSCLTDACHIKRVAAWDGSLWKSLGYDGIVVSGGMGTVKAHSGLNLTSLPLVIARPINAGLYPSISVSNDTAICQTDSITLTASGASTYSWSPSTGLSTSSGNSVVASPSSTTTYTVIGTNALGCSDTANITLTINVLPTVTATSNSSICLGESRVLTGYGASTYSWSPSTGLDTTIGGSVTASPLSTITYTVIGTDTLGCSDNALVTITVHSLPTIVSTADTSISVCTNGIALSASGASSYSWAPSLGLNSTTGSTVNANPTTSTTYTVIGTTVYGCADTTQTVLTITGSINTSIIGLGFSGFYPQCSDSRYPPIICTYSAVACPDSTITLIASECNNSNFIYSWDMGDSTILVGDTISYTYTSLMSDTITLTITDTSGFLTSLVKYIPILINSCEINCCSNPKVYTSEPTAESPGVTIDFAGKSETLFLCKSEDYTLSTSCYQPTPIEGYVTYVTWFMTDDDPLTADTSYNGQYFSFSLEDEGEYVISILTYGPECDSSYITQEFLVYDCNEDICENCIESFSPIPGKKYLVSAWVKQGGAAVTATNYTTPQITILCPSVSFSSSVFVPSGGIIDGWQKIEGELTIPLSATDINIKLECSSGDCYFDDIRVFPYDGSMKSYVYDPVSMKLVAELDERNYATLYEYDEEGKLVRVKKETEKGVMTIKENRNSSSK